MFGTNRNRPWDKPGPVSGTNRLSLFNYTLKSPFCPVCLWDGWGFVPGPIVPQGPSEKDLCVFVYCFSPPLSAQKGNKRRVWASCAVNKPELSTNAQNTLTEFGLSVAA